MSTTTANASLLVPEQRNLFGGLDLVVAARRRGREKSARKAVNVDGRWKVGFATALAIVVEHGKRARQKAHVPQEARCPRCGLIGNTEEHFGTRVLQGRRVPQSWCRNCRRRHPPAQNRAQASLLEVATH